MTLYIFFIAAHEDKIIFLLCISHFIHLMFQPSADAIYLIYLFGSLCLLIYLFIKSVTDLIGDILLNEINPEYSLEGLMLRPKLQYFSHLTQRANSLEKTLMLGKI